MKIPDAIPLHCADCKKLVGVFLFARLDTMTRSAFRLMSGGAIGDMLAPPILTAGAVQGDDQGAAAGGMPIVCADCSRLAAGALACDLANLSQLEEPNDGSK